MYFLSLKQELNLESQSNRHFDEGFQQQVEQMHQAIPQVPWYFTPYAAHRAIPLI